MESYKRLLLSNRAWAHEKTKLKPGFFDSLAKGQKPEFLWIGCSDSRVPAEEISGVEPGEIFVHRNIANLVNETDFNVSSVLQYAVGVLKVKHIIVCGHYGCGGVAASLTQDIHEILKNWLAPLRDTQSKNMAELEKATPEERLNRLVELSVQAQVAKLAKFPVVQEEWAARGAPLIHGWVFGLDDGLLRALTSVGPNSTV